MNLGDDNGFQIRIDQILGDFESFTKNVENTIASDKTDKRDIAIWNFLHPRQFCIGSQLLDRKLRLIHNLHRSLALQTAVAMMSVVKGLKIFALPFQLGVASKPLAAEKFTIVCVVEAFDHAIAPGLRDRDEYRLNTKMQTHAYDQAR